MRSFLAEVHRRDALLSMTGWAHVALAAAFVAGLFLDHRVILGLNPWVKPLKFAVSITIYVWTVAWLLGDVRPRAPRTARLISAGVALSMLAEIVCIALQSYRGVPSHFNVRAAFDGAIFSVMGSMIALNTVLATLLLVLYFVVPTGLARPRVWAVRLGLLLFLLGSSVGGLMVGRQAHAVGVRDGGAGLPFVNWSTEGGDLRVAHALGLHALQVLPLLAFGLTRIPSLGDARQTAVVFGVAAVQLGITAAAMAQALAGQPLLRP
jgi:hypothetical protein